MVRCWNFVCLGRTCKQYPRHRWAGADLSIDEIGLRASIHGLLLFAYQLFLSNCAGSGSVVARGSAGCEADVHLALEGGSAAEAPRLSADYTTSSTKPGTYEHTWVEENETHRSIASLWLQTSPLHMLLAIRTAMEPWRGLMESYMSSAGAEWEREQRCKEAMRQIDAQQ